MSLFEAPPEDQPSIRSNHSSSDALFDNKQRNVEPADNKTWKPQMTKPKNHRQLSADTCAIAQKTNIDRSVFYFITKREAMEKHA